VIVCDNVGHILLTGLMFLTGLVLLIERPEISRSFAFNLPDCAWAIFIPLKKFCSVGIIWRRRQSSE
jgi:hypothetical protein